MTSTAVRPDAGDSLIDKAAEAFTAFCAGDRQRMSDLVALLTPILWHTARAQGLQTAVAEDVVQHAWLVLVEKADTIREPRAVLAWMLVTVRREAWRRRGQTAKVAPLDEQPEPRDLEDAPDEVVVLDDRQALLWSHVSRLSERCRHLLRIIAFAARPDYAAIGQALGMPVGSIGPTRGRCLDKLRRSLESDDHWEGHV